MGCNGALFLPQDCDKRNDECTHPGLMARAKFRVRILMYDSNGPLAEIAAFALGESELEITDEYWPLWIMLKAKIMWLNRAERRRDVTYWLPGAIVPGKYCRDGTHLIHSNAAVDDYWIASLLSCPIKATFKPHLVGSSDGKRMLICTWNEIYEFFVVGPASQTFVAVFINEDFTWLGGMCWRWFQKDRWNNT